GDEKKHRKHRQNIEFQGKIHECVPPPQLKAYHSRSQLVSEERNMLQRECGSRRQRRFHANKLGSFTFGAGRSADEFDENPKKTSLHGCRHFSVLIRMPRCGRRPKRGLRKPPDHIESFGITAQAASGIPSTSVM